MPIEQMIQTSAIYDTVETSPSNMDKCQNCVFLPQHMKYECLRHACLYGQRDDGKNVYFVKKGEKQNG